MGEIFWSQICKQIRTDLQNMPYQITMIIFPTFTNGIDTDNNTRKMSVQKLLLPPCCYPQKMLAAKSAIISKLR